MNSHDLRNLQEAYIDVYEENNETSVEKSKRRNRSSGMSSRDRLLRHRLQRGMKKGQDGREAAERQYEEQVDLYDIILSHLLDEGAAGDVAKRAQKLANQRKGQTPKRKKMYQDLADKAAQRERGPYQRGDTRTGMSQTERDERREADVYRDNTQGSGRSTYGKGGITKNPRKLAQQKSRGQHAEQVDLYDIILSHLLDEGYAETPEAAEVMMVNMSEEWRESICEGLGGVVKRGVNVIRNPIGTAAKDVGAVAKGAIKKAVSPYIEASQKEDMMKHPKYNPSTGKIDPKFNPRSPM